MLFFAHTGFTLAVMRLGECLGAKWLAVGRKPGIAYRSTLRNGLLQGKTDSVPRSTTPLPCIDYRLVLLGSMLPDIIDKPLGMALFRDVFSNGRIFSHTLLFAVVILLCSLVIYSLRRRLWLVTLSGGSLMHLLLDRMWQSPATLLWPAYGWGFERVDISNWLPAVVHSLTHEPMVYLWEIAGMTILTAFLIDLIRRRQLWHFAKRGLLQ